MKLINIPVMTDNYVWLLYNTNQNCLVIDPGDAKPVLQIIIKHKLTLKAILLTHYHDDHIGGVSELLKYYPVPVYGPYETINKGANQIVIDGDIIKLLNHNFTVLSLPGHTYGHIGFYNAPWIFCGDTVFSAGCGRIFEGTAQQMYDSFQKINKLPSNTLICGAHEYTLDNIKFAINLFPKNNVFINYRDNVKKIIEKRQSTLPTTLSLERQVNIFFHCDNVALKKKLKINCSKNEEWRIFAALREKKNLFNSNSKF